MTVPNTMRAIGLSQALPIDAKNALFDFDTAVPQAQGQDLLIAVEAISVNPVDCKQRLVAAVGTRLDTPKILGWDAAGTVVGMGETATRFALGDKVYYAGSVTRSGSNSQYQLVDENIVARAPTTLSVEQAAALPLTSLTAWEALFERLRFPTEHAQGTLLIINGAGGVGSIAIQLAVQAGLTVIATASRPETTAWCKKMGAAHVISHKQPLKAQLATLGLDEIEAALCCVAPDVYLQQIADSLKPQGAVCAIVDNEQPLDIKYLKPKSISLHFEFMFTKTLFATPDMASQGQVLTRIAQLIDAEKLVSTVDTILSPISAATLTQAHRHIEAGTSVGKVVIQGWE